MPETPPTTGIKQIVWTPEVSSAKTVSRFSFVEQVYTFTGQRRIAEVTLAAMSVEDAKSWRAFFLRLNGPAGTFYLKDVKPSRYPYGVATGLPVVASGNSALSSSLLTEGWTADVEDILKAGDEFSISDRIYTATADVDSDSSGDATVPIWPKLGGTAPSQGTSIDTGDDCQGVFFLEELPSWSNNLGAYQSELVFVATESLA